MARMVLPLEGDHIHLAVEGSTGGTTLGLHMAADTIANGGRVLWASPEMPDGVRFGQLFEHLSLADSSRFHAMNLVGSLTQAVSVLLETSSSLPSVKLVVLDDWCDESGRVPAKRIEDAGTLAASLDSSITLLLVSKAGTNAGNSATMLNVRGRSGMEKNGFQIWTLERPKDGPFRILTMNDDRLDCRIEDEGFIQS